MNQQTNIKTDYLNIPNSCNRFHIHEHIMYEKDDEIKDGYILCFRRFGYNWFAWICPDRGMNIPVANIYVGDLIKIEE